MTGLQLYLLIAPVVLLALAWGYAWWIRHSADRYPPTQPDKRNSG